MPEDDTGVRVSLEAVLQRIDQDQFIYGTFGGTFRQLTLATIGINDKVDRLDKKVDRLDQRVDALDKKIDAVEERLDKKIDLMHHDVRQTKAYVERVCGYIERTELKTDN